MRRKKGKTKNFNIGRGKEICTCIKGIKKYFQNENTGTHEGVNLKNK